MSDETFTKLTLMFEGSFEDLGIDRKKKDKFVISIIEKENREIVPENLKKLAKKTRIVSGSLQDGERETFKDKTCEQIELKK